MAGMGMEGRIPAARSVFHLLVIGAVAIVFNVFPGKLGILHSATDLVSFESVEPSAVAAHLSYLNLWWLCAFVLHGFNLALQRWTRMTRGLAAGVNLLGTIVLARVIVGGAIFREPTTNLVLKGMLALLGAVALGAAFRHGGKFLWERPAKAGWVGQEGG
jgi:hypothetical protein